MNLEAVNERVIVLVDLNQKNFHTFACGVIIHHERNWDNFDKKHTEQVLGTVISADNIPTGSLVLFHHNGTHDVNRIHGHSMLSGDDIASGMAVFSILENEIYLYRDGFGMWEPTKGFVIAERVFEPYKGVIQNIPHKKLKDTLYIKTGEFAGKVVRTLKSADYEIIFRSPTTGQEQKIIRCRHFENEYNEREEIVAIDHTLTERLMKGELMVGTSESDCKQININEYERLHN